MKAVVECIKGTREKYELAEDGKSIILNRMLDRKWVESYGYIENTLQGDGDELDTYIIGRRLVRGEKVEVLPICIVYCLDNYQIDNKLICASRTARGNIKARVRKILRFINKYKKGSYALYNSYKDINIRYELARCKALRKLFKGGNK